MFSKKNIFISHSSENKEIALQFSAFLAGLGFPRENVFCSSIIGQGIQGNEELNKKISESIKKSKAIIFLISDDFLRSSYCMEELGVGWYLSQNNKVNCFYFVLPDIKLDEVKGFVNSKVKSFYLLDEDHKNNLGEFAEILSSVFKLKAVKHVAMSNLEDAFFSSTHSLFNIITEKKNTLNEKERKEKTEIDTLKKRVEDLSNIVENVRIENNNKLKREQFRTIEELFFILGSIYGLDKEGYEKNGKQFWFRVINKWKKIQEELKMCSSNSCMHKLVCYIHMYDNNLNEAYKYFLNYLKFEKNSIYVYMIDKFLTAWKGEWEEILTIFKEKISKEEEGLVKDSYVETYNYIKRKATADVKQ